MNITRLVDLHLHSFLVHNQMDRETSFERLQKQIADGQDIQNRLNMDGHVTSSFLLLNKDLTKVLMIHHIGFDKWLCPGGHYEGQVTPRKSALRELEEETGFPSDQVDFFNHMGYLALDIDTHEIPARPAKGEGAHWHHDFLYLGVATDDVALTHQVEEVNAAKWVDLNEAAQLPDERVRRAMAKVQKLIASRVN